MLINWAPIWEGAKIGGGVNLYCQQIGIELVQQGFRVFSVFAGFSYNLVPFSYIRVHKPWQGIHPLEIVNSPCLAPGRDDSGYPKRELQNRRIMKLFQKILDAVNPDVVHFNNIEGFCSDCVRIARKQGARVIFSLHNYHTVCPQVALLYNDRQICYDYENGLLCHHCIPHKSFMLQRIRRGLNSILAATGNPQRYKSLVRELLSAYYSVIQSFEECFHFVYRGIQPSLLETEQKKTDSLSDQIGTQKTQEVFKSVDCSGPQEIGPPPDETNAIYSAYKLRRHSMINSLNACHVVLAVSHFVAQKFIQLGVNSELVKINHIGSRIGKLVETYCERYPSKTVRHPKLPLRFVFLGYSASYKGLPLLLEAFEMLPADRKNASELFIYAQHVGSLSQQIEALRSKLAGLHIHEGYAFSDLPSILKDKDIGVVPPVWWDPAPQVVMELLANNVPIIAAKTGGIPDFIRDGSNGLLFHQGNPEDLAAKICYVLDNPGIVKEWRKHINPIKTVEQHLDELILFYRS